MKRTARDRIFHLEELSVESFHDTFRELLDVAGRFVDYTRSARRVTKEDGKGAHVQRSGRKVKIRQMTGEDWVEEVWLWDRQEVWGVLYGLMKSWPNVDHYDDAHAQSAEGLEMLEAWAAQAEQFARRLRREVSAAKKALAK